MTTFTKEELIAISILVVENKNSAKLQKSSNLSYMESINLGNKIDTMIDNMKQAEWLESQKNNYFIEYEYDNQEMVIKDNLNNIEYRIDINLVYDGKIVPYFIAQNHDDIYVFGNYGAFGFITKEEDIEEFNRVCQEIIDSYTSYKNGESK